MSNKDIEDIVITVTVGGITEHRNLLEDITVGEEDINDYLLDAQGIVAWWNQKYQQINNLVRRQKVKIERCEADLDLEIRTDLEGKEEKYTQAQVDKAIIRHKTHQELIDKLMDLEETQGYIKGAIAALKEKQSTLINLGANKRSEWNHPSRFGKKTQDQEVLNMANRLRKVKGE